MPRAVIQQLKQLRHLGVDPRAEWVAGNRAQLLGQIYNTVAPEPVAAARVWQDVWAALAVFLPRSLVYTVLRPALVLLVVLAVLASGTGAVDAAYETLPGDRLYVVKRAAEQTQAAVVAIFGDNSAQTKLHVEFAKRRAAETKKILRSGAGPDKTNNARAAIADLKSEIAAVSSKLSEGKTQSVGVLPGHLAQDVKQNVEQIKNVLQEVKDNLLVSTSTNDKLLSQEVSETKNLVKDVSVQAVEVMVAKQGEGDTSVSKEEVKQAVNSALQSVTTDAAQSQQTVADAQTIVQAANNEAKDIAQEAKKSATAVTTSTKALTQEISNVANQTVRAVLQTEAVAATVGQKVSEAQTLIVNNDLAQAVDKIKEATNANKQGEKISDATRQQVATVLPVVPVVKDMPLASTSSFRLAPSPGAPSVVSTTAITVSTTSLKK